MRRAILLIALLFLWPASASAQWVWSPETGWVNSRYSGSTDAATLIRRARDMEKQKKHGEASKAFEKIAKEFPKSSQGRQALLHAAENKFKAGQHYEANKLYEQYLDKYQRDRQHKTIAQRRYEIGRALVRGEKRKLLGMKVLQDKSKGEQILLEIISEHPFEKEGKLAPDDVTDDAMFVLANYYYREKRYEEAEAMYRKLREKFPSSEWAPPSLYKIALCQKAQTAGASYDTAPLKKARKTLAEYKKKVPEGTEVKKAVKEIKRVDETLANKLLATGRFYKSRGRKRAARVYLQRLVRKYPKSQAAATAKSLLKELK